MNTNDCGAFCCCMASSHINAMTNLGILAQRKEQGTVVATTKVELTLEDPTLWGKYARHHIGEALHKQHIHGRSVVVGTNGGDHKNDGTAKVSK